MFRLSSTQLCAELPLAILLPCCPAALLPAADKRVKLGELEVFEQGVEPSGALGELSDNALPLTGGTEADWENTGGWLPITCAVAYPPTG